MANRNPNFPIDHQFLTFEHEDQDVWRHAIKWPAYTSDRQPFMHFGKIVLCLSLNLKLKRILIQIFK